MDDNSKTIKDLSENFNVNKIDKKTVEAQHKTIMMLSSTIEKLREENEHLKKLLEDGVQIVNLDATGIDPEVIIAETQLQRLKDLSMKQNLTYEECKKVETYQKILSNSINGVRKKEKAQEDSTPMSTEDLVALMNGTNKQ